jgi:hypothetical protein
VSLVGLRKSTTVDGAVVLPAEGVVLGLGPEVVDGGVTPWPPELVPGIL